MKNGSSYLGMLIVAGFFANACVVDYGDSDSEFAEQASDDDNEYEVNADMNVVVQPGFDVVCGHDYSNAAGWIEIEAEGGATEINIELEGAVPNMLHTVWVKLDGISPVTGKPATAAVASEDFAAMLAITPPNAGSPDVPNGFYTDSEGEGEIEVELDFHLLESYPFPSGDVPLGGGPWSVAVVSHCVDNLGHGLLPGPHEHTYDW